MAKQDRYFSVDVEASGPIPGPWWMPSLGICPTDDLEDGLKLVLKPLVLCYPVLKGIQREDVTGAMKVVSQGVEDFTWDPSKPDKVNSVDLYNHHVYFGQEIKPAFQTLKAWLAARTDGGKFRPYIVGAPLSFDFMWLYWYYQFALGEMPKFGFSGLDMRSYFMGMHGESALRTNKRRYKQKYPTNRPHTHDPLDDAQEQGDIWQQMVTARRHKHLGNPPGTC